MARLSSGCVAEVGFGQKIFPLFVIWRGLIPKAFLTQLGGICDDIFLFERLRCVGFSSGRAWTFGGRVHTASALRVLR